MLTQGLALEGKPALAHGRVGSQPVLEAAKRFSSPERLLELAAQAATSELAHEALHEGEALVAPKRLDAGIATCLVLVKAARLLLERLDQVGVGEEGRLVPLELAQTLERDGENGAGVEIEERLPVLRVLAQEFGQLVE